MIQETPVQIQAGSVVLEGTRVLPEAAGAIILFAHGSGSSRLSPRNNFVAKILQEGGLGTLLFDLLTKAEDRNYEMRFNIPLLTERLIQVTQWVMKENATKDLKIGFFGASTGAASALEAAAKLNHPRIYAVVSRGGRPDLAAGSLSRVKAPSLFVVGGDDTTVIRLNQNACEKLRCEKKMEIVTGASHLFEEPGTLEKAAELAKHWFLEH